MSSSLPAHSVFIFQYHQRYNVILVTVKNIFFHSQGLSFPFQSFDLSKCLLPSEFRNFVYLPEPIDTQYGLPEFWAQWIAGLRPLPSQDCKTSTLTISSFIQLVIDIISLYIYILKIIYIYIIFRFKLDFNHFIDYQK